MTIIEDRPEVEEATAATDAATTDVAPVGEGADGLIVTEVVEEEEPDEPILRPLFVAALSTTAAALMTGGIFGSWTARLLSTAAGLLGVFFAWLVLRSKSRRLLIQLLFLPIMGLIGVMSAVPGSGGASPTKLMSEAVKSGRLLRPPVPFDVGWRPIMIVLFAIVGFSAAWVGTALKRPQMGLILPIPVLALTAISQPAEGQFIAALCGGIPILAAFAVIFGGDAGEASQLGRAFEIKRTIRSLVTMVPVLAAFIVLAQTNFLFPKPVYDPAQKPQKPKAIPLSEAQDRVLFEVKVEPDNITGPWRIGALDVYDGKSWRLPPFDPKRMEGLGNGVIDRNRSEENKVTFTVRDLGNSATLPTTATPAKVDIDAGNIQVDPRTETLRVKSGRVPAGLTYTVTFPTFAKGEQLQAAAPVSKSKFKEFLEIPAPPAAVKDLLAQAPENPWLRLDYLRNALNKVVVATGAGVPGDVTPATVQRLLAGNHEGSPFDIVAAEAMLARWAGVPSRIGFGFDGINDESGVFTIRPKNAAQFLEVYFEGYGWVPIIGQPPKAKQNLDTDPNTKFNPQITPSDDVAVELYIPIELENLRLLYQKVRDVLAQVVPVLVVLFLMYLSLPWIQKIRRLGKRRRWAAQKGASAQIAVEYAELRDLASDLGLGDPYDTPLEFLERVVEDDEHAELAWLTTRALYGDLRGQATEEEVRAARDMSESLRKRMFRAQPFQVRALGLLSRASLAEPYSTEMPNVRMLKLRRPKRVKAPVKRYPGSRLPGMSANRKKQSRRSRRRVGVRS